MPALTNALARFIRPGQRRGFAGLLLAAADRLPLRADAEAPGLAPLPEDPSAPQDPAESLALARMAWAERLWAEGCLIPGGAAEVERLSGLLPLSPATTLLLVGRDAGGAAGTIISRRGAWVAAYQHDPFLAGRMALRLRPFGRRALVLPWQPNQPAFRPRYHHHALALEPLAGGGTFDRTVQALAEALKPDAQLVMLEVVRGDGPASRPILDRWLALEGRPVPPPERGAAEGALQAAGFQIHVAENAAPRQCAAVIATWVRLIEELRAAGAGQLRNAAVGLIEEAELWLLRHRLLSSGAIGLRRWHATLRR
ncbi:hypothetical protein JMJ56_07620 [Belnapia sp. T18]|uniref:Uncharacterized protein n=1 Tax=Belnapia arida TaxID=2804533 RepID=A0ABS1TZL3_9PROT|nr:hypothetical protein [Belnapia arida]MBL6077868.1 hypothetical protein [Belnapia arida]